MYLYNRKDQQGRGLLEVIAVLFIMAILTLGGIWVYRYAIGKRTADVLYEDLLVRGEALRNRSVSTNKKIYDSSLEARSRTGMDISFCPNGWGDTTMPCPLVTPTEVMFDVKVFGVQGYVCKHLIHKDWQLIKESMPTTGVALVQINDKKYAPTLINCDGVENAFDLTIWFWAGEPVGVCEEDGDCPCSCQTCDTTTLLCKSDCPESGKYCGKEDGVCGCKTCPPPTGTYCSQKEPRYSWDINGCPKKVYRPCENGQICVDDSCKSCQPKNTVAEGGNCTEECLECMDGLVCYNGTCQKNPCGTTGLKESECSKDCPCINGYSLFCKGGVCECHFVEQNGDCSYCPCQEGLECIDGVCKKPCDDNEDCPTDCQICDGSEKICAWDAVYHTKGLGVECSKPCECVTDVCENNKCASQTKCTPACDECQVCVDNPDAEGQKKCEWTAEYHSKKAQESCSKDCECDEGLSCFDGKCSNSSTTCDLDCPKEECKKCAFLSSGGMDCQLDTTVYHKVGSNEECSYDCECISGLCLGGVCVNMCETDKECSFCENCQEGVCKPIDSKFHVKTPGQTCYDDCECKSRSCVNKCSLCTCKKDPSKKDTYCFDDNGDLDMEKVVAVCKGDSICIEACLGPCLTCTEDDCPQEFICKKYEVTPAPIPVPPKPPCETECPENHVCYQGACRECSSTMGEDEGCSFAPYCCGEGLICKDGICQVDPTKKKCVSDVDCPEPERSCETRACLNGQCSYIGGCTSNDGCATNETCEDGCCVPVDCDSVEPGTCKEQCQNCPPGENCVDGVCKEKGIEEGDKCFPEDCTPDNPGACCAEGLECVDGICKDPEDGKGCSEKEPCASGYKCCSDQKCHIKCPDCAKQSEGCGDKCACDTDEDCGDDALCSGGCCSATKCKKDSECDSECCHRNMGVCVPKSQGCADIGLYACNGGGPSDSFTCNPCTKSCAVPCGIHEDECSPPSPLTISNCLKYGTSSDGKECNEEPPSPMPLNPPEEPQLPPIDC